MLFRPKVAEIQTLCDEEGFSPKRVADIGAGYGLFLEEWRDRKPAAECIAIEPNGEMAGICRAKGLVVVECFAEEAVTLRNELDLAVALEVIEHVHDPMRFCSAIKDLLKPGGRALFTGLSVDGFDIQVLWERSNSISPPQHINFLSVDGFRALMERVGFRKVKVFTPGKLDVDIAKNMVAAQPGVLDQQRFLRHLLGQDETVLKEFQMFLRQNRMSSHCWIWAEK